MKEGRTEGGTAAGSRQPAQSQGLIALCTSFDHTVHMVTSLTTATWHLASTCYITGQLCF